MVDTEAVILGCGGADVIRFQSMKSSHVRSLVDRRQWHEYEIQQMHLTSSRPPNGCDVIQNPLKDNGNDIILAAFTACRTLISRIRTQLQELSQCIMHFIGLPQKAVGKVLHQCLPCRRQVSYDF